MEYIPFRKKFKAVFNLRMGIKTSEIMKKFWRETDGNKF